MEDINYLKTNFDNPANSFGLLPVLGIDDSDEIEEIENDMQNTDVNNFDNIVDDYANLINKINDGTQIETTEEINTDDNINDISDTVINFEDIELNAMTREQQNRNIVENVFGNDESMRFDELENEYNEDIKYRLLEEINETRRILTEEIKLPLNHIPRMDMTNSIKEIRRIHSMLRSKLERHRSYDSTCEIVITVVRYLEKYFNGERKIAGYNIDLTGWHSTVRTKLRRCRNEMTDVTSGFIEKYNIGFGTRITIELFISLLAHVQKRSINNTMPSAVDIQEDFSDIRNRFM